MFPDGGSGCVRSFFFYPFANCLDVSPAKSCLQASHSISYTISQTLSVFSVCLDQEGLKCVLRSTLGGNPVLLKDARQEFCQSAGTGEAYRGILSPALPFFFSFRILHGTCPRR